MSLSSDAAESSSRQPNPAFRSLDFSGNPPEMPSVEGLRGAQSATSLSARIREAALADLALVYGKALGEAIPTAQPDSPFRAWRPSEGHFLLSRLVRESEELCSQRLKGDAFSAIMLIRTVDLNNLRCTASSAETNLFLRTQAALTAHYPQKNPGALRGEIAGQHAAGLPEKLGVTREEFEQVLLLATRHKVLAGIKDEFVKVLRPLGSLSPSEYLLREEGAPAGRFVASCPYDGVSALTQRAVTIPASLLQVPQGSAVASPSAETSPSERAALVVNYLAGLTLSHTSSAHLSADAIGALRTKIESALISRPAHPLQFSIYTSFEKFAYPLDTRDSNVDPSEIRVAVELKNLIRAVETITGIRPTIILVNESTANGKFTAGDFKRYASQMQELFAGFGIEKQVQVQDFGTKFFVDYLERQGVSSQLAPEVVRDLLGTLQRIYRDLLHGGGADLLKHQSPESAAALREYLAKVVLPEARPHLETVLRFVQQHGGAMQQEAFQAIRTEAQGGVDAALLLPVASEKLLRQCMGDTDLSSLSESFQPIRSWILKQAEEQGVSFKAVMRLRHLMREIFGDSVLSDQVVPLSITNAKDKLSIPLGRSADTELILEPRGTKSVAGVSPQHGTGVVTQRGTIVAVPFSVVREHPQRFRPITVSLNGSETPGYLALADGALVDLDGTLKPHDQELSPEVLAVIAKTLESGIPFGFATGKGRESVQRHIRDPLIRFLESQGRNPNDDCYQTFFVGGNNGAWASTGLASVTFTDERRIDLATLQRLPESSTARELIASYLGVSPSALITADTFKVEDRDEFSLYLEPSPLRQVLEKYGYRSSAEVIASLLNGDFEQYQVPLRAHANSGFIDIVDELADKGRSAELYHAHLEQVLRRPVNPFNIFRCGDSPAGNDMQLLRGGVGRSVELTSQGPVAVAQWISLILNLS
jgi:hypothetical protein